MMNAPALLASQSADDQDYFFPLIINADPLSAADYFQPSVTAGATNLLLAPNKKPLLRGSLSVYANIKVIQKR